MIPFFFLKIKKGKDYHVFNPVDNKEYVVDYFAYRILEQCDGAHNLEQIANIVSRDVGKTRTDALDYITEILNRMYGTGMIAWKQEKIDQRTDYTPPSNVYWDITGNCNLRCSHCYDLSERPHGDELSTEEAKRTVEEMATYGIEKITFSGGEPLLRNDFLEIATHASNFGFKAVGLATNGTLIDHKIARQLKEANLDVQVSIDGDVSEIHDAIRNVRGAFDSAIRGIKLLQEEGIDVTTCTTVTKLNVERIPNIIQLMQGLNVNNYRVQGMVPIGRGKKNEDKLRLAPSRMKELVEYLDLKNIPVSSYTFTLKPPPTDPVDFCGSGACGAGTASCSITSEGNVVPCSHFWGMNGDNLRDHSFPWIWENSSLLNYFRSIRLGDIKGLCRECKWLLYCHGGCKAENYANGDIFDSNRNCWVADETRRTIEIGKRDFGKLGSGLA